MQRGPQPIHRRHWSGVVAVLAVLVCTTADAKVMRHVGEGSTFATPCQPHYAALEVKVRAMAKARCEDHGGIASLELSRSERVLGEASFYCDVGGPLRCRNDDNE